MKLAGTSSLREDLEKRISGLKDGIEKVVKIQKGDEPTECPEELMSDQLTDQ